MFATFIKNKYHVEKGKLKTAPGVNHNVAEMLGSADDGANRSNELHVEGFIVFEHIQVMSYMKHQYATLRNQASARMRLEISPLHLLLSSFYRSVSISETSILGPCSPQAGQNFVLWC